MLEDKNIQQTESISDIISKIDKELIVLPDFQRDFVWDESKSYELFDSLCKDIFIGSIIYGIPSFEITVRQLDCRPRKKKKYERREKLKTIDYTEDEIKKLVEASSFRTVLDGQQRLTSIYRSLKGIDDIWFIVNDLDNLDDYKNLLLEEFLFSIQGKQETNKLSIKLSDVYEIMCDMPREKIIQEKYFYPMDFVKNLNENDSDIQYYFDVYYTVIHKIQDMLKSEKLVSYFLLNMNSDKFALFFERSNSSGIKLDFIDILTAKLHRGFHLRNKIEEFQDQLQFKVDRDILVRCVAYFVSHGKNIDKGYILSDLTYTHFNEYWDILCKLYKDSVEFLKSENFIVNYDWMPHVNMLIPIIMFLNNLPNKSFSQMTEEQFEFIKYWYWGSIFSQRYVGAATNELIIRDSFWLSKIAIYKKITDSNFFKSFKFVLEDYKDLYQYNKKGSAIYKGILNFVNFTSRGLTDWNNSRKIVTNFSEKLDDHHIFPKAYIKEIDPNDEYLIDVDCVINRTLIPKITNVKIGKRSPSKYMNEIKNKNNDFKKSLETHLIPVTILDCNYDDFYDGFIAERAKLIFDKINNSIFKLTEYINKGFYEEKKFNDVKIVPVYAIYNRNKVEATYNLETQKILYKGQIYAVSSAAVEVKKEFGKQNASVNGWNFWKYTENGEEKKLQELRY